MNHRVIPGPARETLKIFQACYLPFAGTGFTSNYWQKGPFLYDILAQPGGTCGAPVLCTDRFMAGFLTGGGGTFSSDGTIVTVSVPEGQKLLLIEGGTEREQWELYHSQTELPRIEPVEKQDFWYLPEYVTWVEQKAAVMGTDERQVYALDEKMVLDFADRILALGLPAGKLTIDDGWQTRLSGQAWTDGYWTPDGERFPDMAGLADKLRARGFVPSLWMGIPSVPAGAPILTERPELFDEDPRPEGLLLDRIYYKPGQALTDHFRERIAPFAEMGFRKFKFDFFYGPRGRMRDIMACLHRAVRSIDRTLEIEGHHSDPFFSCWTDAFRMNDVIIQPGLDWRGLTLAHMNLGRYIGNGNILNLDHAGGNNPQVGEEDYLEHLRLYDLAPDMPRYPVVSLLPDRFSPQAVEELKAYLKKHTCPVQKGDPS